MQHAVDVDRYCSEVISLLILLCMKTHTHTPVLIERRPTSEIWRSYIVYRPGIRYRFEVIYLLLLVYMKTHTHTPVLIEWRPTSEIWRSYIIYIDKGLFHFFYINQGYICPERRIITRCPICPRCVGWLASYLCFCYWFVIRSASVNCDC